MKAKFELGEIVATARVAKKMEDDAKFRNFVMECLLKYMQCDWGVLPKEDTELNEESLQNDGRILASYPFPEDISEPFEEKLWIITEWDRSCTTILFPRDY